MQAKENLGRYTGVVNCAASLLQTEGPLALYKGLESHLWRNAVWNGEEKEQGRTAYVNYHNLRGPGPV